MMHFRVLSWCDFQIWDIPQIVSVCMRAVNSFICQLANLVWNVSPQLSKLLICSWYILICNQCDDWSLIYLMRVKLWTYPMNSVTSQRSYWNHYQLLIYFFLCKGPLFASRCLCPVLRLSGWALLTFSTAAPQWDTFFVVSERQQLWSGWAVQWGVSILELGGPVLLSFFPAHLNKTDLQWRQDRGRLCLLLSPPRCSWPLFKWA